MLIVTGTIEPTTVAGLASPAEGPVVGCRVREGDRVTADQELLRIGRQLSAEAAQASAREELRRQEQEFQRITALVAEKAIAAARTLSENPQHADTATRLADFAERLGSHPSACLRVRATALATLADFEAAHSAWIDLITHQPETTHLPTDYTEAAHTAFETGDPRQAIEILNTGLFRFPDNPSAAIRSGWIALLTDHTEDALRYLNHATKLGLPPAEIENTTALLAIAHERLGDHQAAASHLAQLKAISPKWSDAETLAKLPWPQPFKDSLNAIILSDGETEPWPSPESDPTDTVPFREGFPTEEPPLPSR